MDEIGLFDAIHSARALRRLKPDPVPEELLNRVLGAAICAPSAGNAQNWAFIVVRDAELRRSLGAIYRREEEVKTVLALPPEMRTYALMPIGYPRDKFGALSRRPVMEVAWADRYGNPWVGVGPEGKNGE